MRALVIGVALTLGAAAPVDIASLARPSIQVFTDKEGLAQPTAEALAVDAKGYLWVGTQHFPVRFNGREWQEFPLPGGGAGQWVRCIWAARDGGLWFGRDHTGVCRLSPEGGWSSFTETSGLPPGPVMALRETRDHGLLAGTGQGVYRFDGVRWNPLCAGPWARGQVNALLEDIGPEGGASLWIGAERGLGHLVQEALTWEDHRNGLPSNDVVSLFQSETDRQARRLWVGTGQGLVVRAGASWITVGPEQGVPRNRITSMAESVTATGHRTLWIATYAGLIALHEGSHRLGGHQLWGHEGPGWRLEGTGHHQRPVQQLGVQDPGTEGQPRVGLRHPGRGPGHLRRAALAEPFRA